MRTLLRLLSFSRPVWRGMALSLILSILTITCSIGLMGTSAYLISSAALQPSIATLQVAIVGVRFFGIGRGVFRYLERLASHSVNLKLLAEIRLWVYRKLEPLVPARTLKQTSGDILAILTADIDTLENLYVRVMAPPITAVFIAAGMFVFLGSINKQLGIILVIGMLIGGGILPLMVLKLTKNPGSKFIEKRAELNSLVTSTLQGAGELVVFGAEIRQKSVIMKVSDQFGKAQMRLAGINGFGSGSMIWILNFTILAILATAVTLVTSGALNGVLLAVIVLMTAASFEAIIPLILSGHQLEPALAAGRRIFTLTDSEPAVLEPVKPVSLPKYYDMEISRLSFNYPDVRKTILSDFTLSIPEGKHVAIVGPSGSGKSTFVNLLGRIWDYPSGSIRLGGMEVKKMRSEDTWQKISLLAQNPVILTDTLRRNLEIGKKEASDGEMIAALEMVQMGGWFAGLPKGLESWLGERGARMSAGERQRLAIARMNLRNCPVQIYDEPTANLDMKTEKDILDLVLGISGQRTIIWVTHRLVGLEKMDEIVFIEKGRILERGKQSDLLNQGGQFVRYFEIQNEWLDDSLIGDI